MKRFIPISEPSLAKRDSDYVLKAMRSGWVSSLGEYIDRFEKEFAAYTGTRYALATCNGTTALHLALASFGIGPGDEVIVPDLTFIATANAVRYTGATPVMTDIDPRTWCLAPDAVLKAISSRTRAILPVHVYGYPADMEALCAIAAKYKLIVLEDAAEAHGAEINGKKVGAWGNAGVFSFYGNKIITTGEGGMITTDDEALYRRAVYLRDHGMSKERRYWHDEMGFNYRITNLQAALGCAQLERIEEFIAKRQKIFGWYNDYLKGIPGISLNPRDTTVKSVIWMVCMLLDNGLLPRDHLMAELKKRGIDSRPFFYPLTEMPVYKSTNGNLHAREISHKGLNLPSSAKLSRRDVKYVCDAIKDILRATHA